MITNTTGLDGTNQGLDDLQIVLRTIKTNANRALFLAQHDEDTKRTGQSARTWSREINALIVRVLSSGGCCKQIALSQAQFVRPPICEAFPQFSLVTWGGGEEGAFKFPIAYEPLLRAPLDARFVQQTTRGPLHVSYAPRNLLKTHHYFRSQS